MQVDVIPDITEKTSIVEVFKEIADLYPENIAYKAQGGRGESYTYQQVSEIVDHLADGLINEGLVKKPEIGILSENRPEWCMTYLAILNAGGTVVPIDANLKEDEIFYIIEHAGLDVVFASKRFIEILKKHSGNLTLFSFDRDLSPNWQELWDTEPTDKSKRPVPDTAVLIYTSGTTGAPKAVELTHKNLLANIMGIQGAFKFNHDDKFLSVLPLHHTFEATCGFLTPMTVGATVVYARSLKSKQILEDMNNNEITVICVVPLLFEKMYHAIKNAIDASSFAKRLIFNTMFALSKLGWVFGLKFGKKLFRGLRGKAGLKSMRIAVSGGAALPRHIAAFFNYIGVSLFQGYGMTECSPVISANRIDNMKFGSVGPPLENIQVKIENPDASGVGEIIVKGDNITPGYRNNPEMTTELIKNGWLYTGDLGKLADGHLWITGRRKNLIISAAGKNIYPEELEKKLLTSNLILEAVVYGRKKENKMGEEIRAVIVPDMEQLRIEHPIETEKPDMEKIKVIIGDEVKNLNEKTAEYKRITFFDVQLNELEKTSIKKVRRTFYK